MPDRVRPPAEPLPRSQPAARSPPAEPKLVKTKDSKKKGKKKKA